MEDEEMEGRVRERETERDGGMISDTKRGRPASQEKKTTLKLKTKKYENLLNAAAYRIS